MRKIEESKLDIMGHEDGEGKVHQLQEKLNDANRRIEELITSSSWRFTRPLRVASRFQRRLVRGILDQIVKPSLRVIVGFCYGYRLRGALLRKVMSIHPRSRDYLDKQINLLEIQKNTLPKRDI